MKVRGSILGARGLLWQRFGGRLWEFGDCFGKGVEDIGFAEIVRNSKGTKLGQGFAKIIRNSRGIG